jgi:hypothetical protein
MADLKASTKRSSTFLDVEALAEQEAAVADKDIDNRVDAVEPLVEGDDDEGDEDIASLEGNTLAAYDDDDDTQRTHLYVSLQLYTLWLEAHSNTVAVEHSEGADDQLRMQSQGSWGSDSHVC